MTKAPGLCYQVFVKRFCFNVLVKNHFGCILADMKIRMLFALAFLTLTAKAQQLPVVKIDSQILVADVFVGYDNFGHGYFITNNIFCKTRVGADLTGSKPANILEYKNLSLGRITRADIRNPLQVLLFYENFNTVVLLDNQLNETQQIRFSEYQTPIVASAVGMAASNRLWVFNSLSQKVGLFDYVRNDYREITVPIAGKIEHYESDFNYFHWISDGKRFATDVYGKITEYGPMLGFEQFHLVDDDWILYSKDGKIYAHAVKTDNTFTLGITEKTFKSFHYQAQNLAIFTKQGITNYKITLP